MSLKRVASHLLGLIHGLLWASGATICQGNESRRCGGCCLVLLAKRRCIALGGIALLHTIRYYAHHSSALVKNSCLSNKLHRAGLHLSKVMVMVSQ